MGKLHQEQTCAHASYRGIMGIFPPYMRGAINPKDGSADVTMVFPLVRRNGLTPYCLVSLVIKANEVAFIVMQLFKAHIGTGDEIRYFVLPNGGRLLPRPGFQFQGSLDSDIHGLLGHKIST
ncbi:hypothetical protein B0T19DRAFT_197786 [Cercophora scortea]|uniref:Uncharacterized protein n=1 Tax=Cercophora scortea TaxID=314031 RepID=A0AAE0IQJ6_9PEZI|nr:hypothetical protein B0T19DRAFT_197786 [Cercophora scortea]